MSKLKIYMCSGIGDTREEYAYWLDDTNTATNTCAVNSLLARINELCVELDYLELTPEEQLERYNMIDLLVIALQLAKRCKKDDAELERAGKILQQFINDGKFNSKSREDSERGSNLDRLFSSVMSALDSGSDPKVDGDFLVWWMESILPNNRCGLTPEQQEKSKEFLKEERVGDSLDQYKKQYGDIGEYLYNASDYFLYLYIPEDKAKKLPYFLRKKIQKQQEVYNYVARNFKALYGNNQEDLERIIRTRIIAQTGKTPEAITNYLTSTRGIGVMGWDDILYIVIAAVAVTIALLQVIFEFCQNVIAIKYAEPQNIDDGLPELYKDWNQSSDNTKIWKFGIVAAVLYYIFKKK